MDPEPAAGQPQPRPAPRARPLQPVPAPREVEPGGARPSGGRLGVTALTVFAALLVSAVVFKDGLRQAWQEPAASDASPSAPAPQLSAPQAFGRAAVPAPQDPSAPSPLPFYGEAGVETEPGSGFSVPDGSGGLVPYQPQTQAAAARPLPQFRTMPNFSKVAAQRGSSAGGLRLSGFQNPSFIRGRPVPAATAQAAPAGAAAQPQAAQPRSVPRAGPAAPARTAGAPLPGAALPTLAGPQAAPTGGGPSQRTVTIYLSPDCGYCRDSAEKLIKMRDELRAQGIATRVIVGAASDQRVKDFAAQFGSDTMLDPSASVGARGYPSLWVTDGSGQVIRTRLGAPASAEDGVGWASSR